MGDVHFNSLDPTEPIPNRAWLLYFGIMIFSGAFLILYAVIGYSALAPLTRGFNFFAPISYEGDPAWYRDLGGQLSEIQDQFVFYHNIGPSIAAARSADIIILGPSFSAFAFDSEELRRFEKIYGLKVYNMSFIAIRGGEFSIQIAERWGLRPKLWIINVDDQAIHFFSRYVTAGPTRVPILATQLGRIGAFGNVIGRNLRWRLESLLTGENFPSFYRNVVHGDVMLQQLVPKYLANDNGEVRFDNGRVCHANKATIGIGREFLSRLRGDAVFTLVPHSQACRQQAYELSAVLNRELIAPPFDHYTSVDGGGHLDKMGAEKFTSRFLSSLAETKTFKRVFDAR